MQSIHEVNIDEATISKIGLRLTDNTINAQISPDARVFIYPFLEDVYVMESDLYGNQMPKGSCFLAFNGQHGLIGKHLSVEVLQNATLKEIKDMVQSNCEG
ncbi:MAG: hypothetical protein EOO10_21365 [Chitinophagaceae bacterium]|nr:MAG: hypothetical protein EOO10_21365 [Chitinophagaceae bacterium]